MSLTDEWIKKSWCIYVCILYKLFLRIIIKEATLSSSFFIRLMVSLVAQRSKGLPLIQKTWVRSLGREDPLEKEMATHSSILAWRIPRMEEPGGLQSMGSQRVGHD